MNQLLCAHRWAVYCRYTKPTKKTRPNGKPIWSKREYAYKKCDLCHAGWSHGDVEPRVVVARLE